MVPFAFSRRGNDNQSLAVIVVQILMLGSPDLGNMSLLAGTGPILYPFGCVIFRGPGRRNKGT